MFLWKTKAENPRVALLRKVELFQDLKRSQLVIVSELLHERDYLKGEVVFDEGDVGQALFMVVAGRVKARRPRSRDAAEVEFGPGKFFGELALLDDAPRSSQVIAAEDSTLLALFRTDFLALLETHSRIASQVSLALARDLAGKLRRFIAEPPK
jgi:CRP-like cAMP-binding protein